MPTVIYRQPIGASLIMACAVLVAGACTPTVETQNTPGRETTRVDPEAPAENDGIGFSSKDIINLTDRMSRDMLNARVFRDVDQPPNVIVDAAYFTNQGSSRIDKDMITDRLRENLNRAAEGRMRFLARENAKMVEAARERKRDGDVSSGRLPNTKDIAGGDYRLKGRITTRDTASVESGRMSRFHYISFELVNLETSVIVWSNGYSFKKAGQNDVVYQ